MSWMRKFSSARLSNNTPLNDTVPEKGDHEHPHAQGPETTDNPEGTETLSDKVYGDKKTTFSDWEDVDGKQQRTVLQHRIILKQVQHPVNLIRKLGLMLQKLKSIGNKTLKLIRNTKNLNKSN